jgi:hypothetical protein
MKRSWGLRGSTGHIIALGRLYEVLGGSLEQDYTTEN